MPLGMLGKYERLDVLGHGVSGIVYLAKDTLLNKQIALKEVDVQAGDLRRFLEEARVMDRLRHPNIVRVNGVDRIDGKVVIDMEYVRGANLQDILREEGPMPLNRALEIASQVLAALDYAHTQQTVHRDIKPANILIGRDGSVKIVDFGLAEILATNAYAGGAGTYAYMAPEDFAEEDRSDSQSDIWAVGVTLFEMLSGERPFQVVKVKDPFAWKRTLDTQEPTSIQEYVSGASDALDAVLSRALARDKRDRYQTAGEFRDDLLRLQMDREPSGVTLRLDRMNRERQSRTGNGRSGLHAGFRDWSGERNWNEDNSNTVFPTAATGQPTPASVVANANDYRPDGRRPRLRFLGRRAGPRLTIDPDSVDFGAVRKGEQRTVKVQARIMGTDGKAVGTVLHTPGWLTVHPVELDRTRQTITLTAHTARAWETGEFTETVRIESNAGTVDIPVHLSVLKPRPTFAQVAPWFLPLFFCTLLPALAVAFGCGTAPISQLATSLIPAAAVGSGLLAVMLLLICITADVGMAERVCCSVVLTVMCFVLGMSVAAHRTYIADSELHYLVAPGLRHAYVIGGTLVGALLLQLLHMRRWKLWAVVLAALGIYFGGSLMHVLSPSGLR